MDMTARFHARGHGLTHLERNRVSSDGRRSTTDQGSGSAGGTEQERGNRNGSGTGNIVPPDEFRAASDFLNRHKPAATGPEAARDAFRRPTLPASASRGGTQPTLNQRRRSTLRENVRVPSGPREYPTSAKRTPSISSFDPSLLDTTNTSFLPPQHQSYAAARNPSEESLDFLPAVNFDDFQNSLSTPSYDAGTASPDPLLSDFPLVPGRRAAGQQETVLDKYTAVDALGNNGFMSTPVAFLRQDSTGDGSSDRRDSFRKRLSTVPGSRYTSAHHNTSDTLPGSHPNMSARSRRQSSVPLAVPPSTQPPAASRPPRKSVGPSLITGMMEGKRPGQASVTPAEPTSKAGIGRTLSIGKAARRSTIQPSLSAGAELPRVSTLLATTQSRANKVKSLQPLARDPNTPHVRSVSKGSQSRAHTPSSSSGNRRQSTVANGRASGLGARTVSPTDARRLKRMSMMPAPPMPTTLPKEPPPPSEESRNGWPVRPEQPRLAQPSPSLIPRKTRSTTPTSVRSSPDPRPALVARPSVQSLASSSTSTSRLPTPRGRNVHSSSAQYSEDTELVPPVPAIPKAYESPQEHDTPFFYPSSLQASQSALDSHDEPLVSFDFDESFLPPPDATSHVPRDNINTLVNMSRKPSGEYARHSHKRSLTASSSKGLMNGTGGLRSAKPQPEATGRRNNNLQPLRLPPLNLQPIKNVESGSLPDHSRPGKELEPREYNYLGMQTPEPHGATKPPSTPMTASKATFYRRPDEDFVKQKVVRSSSSHYALRDVMHYDDNGSIARFFDDDDDDRMKLSLASMGVGVPMSDPKERNAITPFASGSLPKNSGDLARSRPRLNGDYEVDDADSTLFDDLHTHPIKSLGPRPNTMAGTSLVKDSDPLSSDMDSPTLEPAPRQLPGCVKKEPAGSGLRRKMSLGWRRSNSKAAQHSGHSSTSQQAHDAVLPSKEDDDGAQEKKRHLQQASEMPPPRLPASVSTNWLIDGPLTSPRSSLSLEQTRRRSVLNGPLNGDTATMAAADGGKPEPSATPVVGVRGIKTRSIYQDHPQPIGGTGNRSSSWSNLGVHNPNNTARTAPSLTHPSASISSTSLLSKHRLTHSITSANVKDKDDLIADDEMRRLSQKRRDVDTAARDAEALKARAVARTPMRPDQVLHDRNFSLNIFERGEIMDYEKDGIFFTGTKAAKKIIGSVAAPPSASGQQLSSESKAAGGNNFGYDDERGDYNIVFGDHLAYRYEVIDVLGKGSFGQVVRCVDHKIGCVVAVKIIRNKKRFHQQALVEVGILGRLGEWDPDGAKATLSITSSFYFRSHLCIVTPCLSINLYELIRAHNFVGFSLPLIRRFARQLLACLVLLQQKRIIHCDLKPENILLCEARKADVRVIDFGSSCREEEKVYTYIQSRFYRSPEVILGSSYSLGIDMWSLGCILAELWTGYPIFPGENEQEQLACIMEIFGPPDRHLVERCTRKKLFFDSVGKPRVTVSSKGRRRRPSSKTLAQALKTEDEAFLDFVTRCLRWDPDRRLKPADAIIHPFVTNTPPSQRPAIPDEARRAARVRSTAASMVATGVVPSPTKRATAHPSSVPQSTPIRERASREIPQTALRATTTTAPGGTTGSPRKPTHVIDPGRRHSTIATAGLGPALIGNKRASNAAALSGGGAGSNLAQLAASGAMAGVSPREPSRGRL